MNQIFLNTKRILLAVIFSIILFTGTSYPQKYVVAYYPDYMKYSLPPDKIAYQNLTHIIHAFASPKSNGEINTFEMLRNNFNSIVHNAGKKILLGLGGWGQSDGFVKVSSDPDSLTAFINNVINIIKQYSYDGVDLDWEFPKDAVQKDNLTKLVAQLRKAFDAVDSSLIITFAAPVSDYYGQYYDFEKLKDNVTLFSVMAFHFFGEWSNVAGPNAPLYENPSYPNGCAALGVKYLNETRKIPSEKLLLGIPFFGEMFNAQGLYKARTGTVTSINYSEVSAKMDSAGWDYFWDDVSKVPYLLDAARTKFITFDDTASIRVKCEYANNKMLGGVMIWALAQDNYNNTQPLLEKIGIEMGLVPSIVFFGNENVTDYKLFNNYPNPFNSSTKIKFAIPAADLVNLSIYNSLGKLVTTLYYGNLNAGIYEINFSANSLSSGIYYSTLTAGNTKLTKRMVHLK